MADQNRTEEQTLIIEDFEGVNQLIDELKLSPGATPYMRGCYATERENVKRLPGKALSSSITTGGHVLTIQQLVFTDRNTVLVHRSSNYSLVDDISELQSEPDISPLVPTEPFIYS